MCAEPVARVALVVEDEWLVRDDIVSELKAQGWTVVETATGEEALALLAIREVHVLLTDIQLAGAMNGWEVAHAGRASRPELPAIYASGNTPDPSQQVAGGLFVSKPYAPADVAEACQRLAEASRC
jgi:CheY-like chemotaxis protein